VQSYKEKNLSGKYIPNMNPSENISIIEFYYNPLMEKQRKYKVLQRFPEKARKL